MSPASLSDREDEEPFWIFHNNIEWLPYTTSTFTISVVVEDHAIVNPCDVRLIIGYDQQRYDDVDLIIKPYQSPSPSEHSPRPWGLRPGRMRSNILYQNSFRTIRQHPTTPKSDSARLPLVVVLSLEDYSERLGCTLKLRQPPLSIDNVDEKWRIIFDHTQATCSPNQPFHLSLTAKARHGSQRRSAHTSWTYLRILPLSRKRASAAIDFPPQVTKLIMHFSINALNSSWRPAIGDLRTFIKYTTVRKSWLLPVREVFFRRLGLNEKTLRIPDPLAFSRYLLNHPQFGEMVTAFSTRQLRYRGLPESSDIGPVSDENNLPETYKNAINSILAMCPAVQSIKTSPLHLDILSPILPNLKRLKYMTLTCWQDEKIFIVETKILKRILESCQNLTHLEMSGFDLIGQRSQSSDVGLEGLSIPLESLAMDFSAIDGPFLLEVLPRLPHGLKVLDLHHMDCTELTNKDFETVLRLQSHSLETIKLWEIDFEPPPGEVHAIESVLPEMSALKLLHCHECNSFTACIFSGKLRVNSELCEISVRCRHGGLFFNESANISLAGALEITGWDRITIVAAFWTMAATWQGLSLPDIISQAREVAERRGIELVIPGGQFF